MKKQSSNLLSEPEAVLANEALQLVNKYRKLEDRYAALLKLNQLSIDCADITIFFGQIHSYIASLMNAKNFYIVIYDQTFATIEFAYHVDENDTFPSGALPLDDFEGSLTRYVLESAKPMLATPELIEELSRQEKIKMIGAQGIDWLGVPLMQDGFVVGMMSVQSYTESTRYQEDDLELLNFTAQHVVTAMTRLEDRDQLKKAVDARTKELIQQIREREKSELLQESLFRISELTGDVTIDIDRAMPLA